MILAAAVVVVVDGGSGACGEVGWEKERRSSESCELSDDDEGDAAVVNGGRMGIAMVVCRCSHRPLPTTLTPWGAPQIKDIGSTRASLCNGPTPLRCLDARWFRDSVWACGHVTPSWGRRTGMKVRREKWTRDSSGRGKEVD